jgi:hypothetical protein
MPEFYGESFSQFHKNGAISLIRQKLEAVRDKAVRSARN